MNSDPSEPIPTDDQSPYNYEGTGEVIYDGAEGTEVDNPAPQYDQGAVYDPGAAFAEENLQFGTPDIQYVDPNQAYYDPGKAYADPGSVYSDPNQVYYAEPSEPVASGGVYDEAPAPAPVRSTSSRSRAQKKKVVARRVPKPSPKLPRGGSAGSKYKRPSYAGGGISMMSVLIAVVAMGMLAGVGMILLPADTSKIAGYPISSIPVPNPRNLVDEVQKIMIERKELVTFKEEEVNQYLNSRLQGSQKGVLAALIKFKGVYVDFSPGVAEIFVVREVFGKTLTMSSRVTPERGRAGIVYKPVGWSLGRVDLGVRSVKPVVQLFLRLRGACLEEFQTLQQMGDVRIEENQIVLDSAI